MRVLETKKPGLQISMGKRKHKLRKQREDSSGFCSESSDEGVTARGCPHVSKAVNLNSVRKALRLNPVIGECTDCRNDSTTTVGATGGSDDVDEAVDVTVWICLQCAHQGCGRESEHKHALKHCKTPRSSSHAMVLNVTHRMIWCYDCDEQVLSPANGKLHECVEYVCKHMGVTSNSIDSPQPGLKRSGSQKSDGEEVTTQSSTSATDSKNGSKKETLQDLKQPKAGGSSSVCQSLSQALPKVRGLSNLGNTCFFNAVMQSMSQTYLLGHVMEELNTKDMKLPGCPKASEDDEDEGQLSSSEEAGSDDEFADCKIQLDPLNISLGDIGVLTKSVLEFYRDMNGGSRNGTLSPSSLFNQVCKKVPRFKGFQQQDSHELLRHLLDGMKGDEIRRRQEAILKQFDLADTWKRKKVPDDTKLKIKVYGRQAKRTFIDNVFGGHFISTVLCEDCRTPSQIFEPFLDISLPITEEKTVRPNSQWGGRGKKERPDSSNNEDLEMDSKAKNGLSKHALKKAHKQAKKEAKKKKTEDGIEGKKDEESSGKEKGDNEKTKSDEAISDADEEDNVEQASGQQGNSAVSSSEDSTVKGSVGAPTSSDVSSSRTKVDTEQSEATSTCHSETTEGAGSQAEEVTALANGLQSMQLQEDSGIAMDLNHKAADAQRCHEKQLHAKEQRAARMRAMTSLANRYHAVSQECSIMSCLNQFTAPELLTGNNKFGCVVCTRQKNKKSGDKDKTEMVLANASKQLLILQLPPVLTLHLKRFQQMGFSLRKVNRHVEFPMLLDVAPYCSALCQGIKPNQTRVLYSLYGIVEHSGRLTGGHYTAYVKVRAKNQQQQQQKFLSDMSSMSIDSMVEAMRSMSSASASLHEDEATEDMKPPPGKWYYISDSRVNEVTHEANILRCQAYLLFYERIY
ncbi:hypothetical protein CAPTEDRAFT_225117 [Capitella teleta]|uniref:Ubiquitin carboxyl-terminal hydrolase n=1 Tax=Capitella teleta TaxID=283909 RepID=R7TT06_CAPTE|nr:hypothetical protein CAPTEDRAFT_225117 [Capitella teleta]|eukprot:ELT96769.1 hypothetical protein CAPTEDRAFT_225117 [Capitella teleta]